MEKISERRVFKRYRVPDAMVYYAEEQAEPREDRIAGDGVVDDFSEKGIRFITRNKIPTALSINLVLTMPGKEQVFIMANVVWVSDLQNEDKRFVFVEFKNFGDKPGFNPTEAQASLKKLISQIES